jgi:putative transposase
MARLPRIDVPNVPQHVVQRGNNRQAMFFHDGDFPVDLGYLREALIKHDCSLDAYVLMTHHAYVLTLGKVTGAISRCRTARSGLSRPVQSAVGVL